MSSRKTRRAAAHQARKAARHAVKLPNQQPEPVEGATSQAQIEANRANAQHSTGPRTEEGKAISSQNRTSHGLAGKFRLLSWEHPEEYLALYQELLDHYQPVGPIELGYVERLSQHSWLRQRSLDLQYCCFDADDPEQLADPQQFAVFARYESQQDRAMDRCVNMLAKLQKERRQEQIGFESQIRQEAAETRGTEAHEVKMRIQNARLKVIEAHPAVRETAKTPLPAPIPIPVEPRIEQIPENEVAA